MILYFYLKSFVLLIFLLIGGVDKMFNYSDVEQTKNYIEERF